MSGATLSINNNAARSFQAVEILPTNKSLLLKLPDARLARTEEAEFTNVNERLKGERNNADGTFRTGFWDIAKKYAGIIDSRESITRLVLDLTAFDIPVMIAGATRNWKSFLEACLEGAWSSTSLILAPLLTKTVANVASNFCLNANEKPHFDKISRFYREELTDETSFQKGLQRILAEEPQDLNRVGKLYGEIKNFKKEQKYFEQANELEGFISNLSYSEDAVKRFNKLKEATIIGQSCFEGLMWGGFGLALRWFRKNILKEERFTGTKKYLSDADSKKLGEADQLNPIQKIFGGTALFLSPLLNSIFMSITRDPKKVNASPFLKTLRSGLDMTHGLFPKLGLLFSYTTVPKWFGAFGTTQGSDEFIERLIKFFTLIPSWWLGHRVANGTLASYFDKKLADKHGVEQGILVEPHYVGKWAPDPAKIHHVLERTQDNPELQKDARDAHAKTLYAGITLHSIGVLLVTLAANQITKWRVESKKKALAA